MPNFHSFDDGIQLSGKGARAHSFVPPFSGYVFIRPAGKPAGHMSFLDSQYEQRKYVHITLLL